MTVLCTGAAGMVGSYVSTIFPDTVLTDIHGDTEYLDVTNQRRVMAAVTGIIPDVVLHLAAKTDVDACETEVDDAWRVNTIGTQNVALACQRTGATMVYVSTAGVFSGQKSGPYTEFDKPAPANVYGHTKLAGERIVRDLLSRFYIVRAGWMMGGAGVDKKFVAKIYDQIQAGALVLRAVDDKFGSPTYARDLLHGIQRLLLTDAFGLYHMTNAGTCSRYDVACAVRDVCGSDASVEPVSSEVFPLPAPRARSEMMRNYQLQLQGMPPMRSWFEALEEYMLTELMVQPSYV